MPIYEYRCKKGHTFEVMQRISADPVTECEVCGAPVGRVFHPVAVHFKGSGFYNTDYGTRKRSREMKEGAGSDGAGAKDAKDGSASSSSGSDSSGSGSESSGSSKSSDSGSAKDSGAKKAKASTGG